jgi:hypothetical protein
MSLILHQRETVVVVFLEDQTEASSFSVNLLKSPDLLTGGFLDILFK